jgi:hypothetical protein
MRLRNKTKFSTELIREIVRFAKPSGLHNFTLHVKSSRNGWHGHAWGAGDKYATIYVPRGTTEKTKYTRPTGWNIEALKKGYINSKQFTPIEDMVHLIAHELRHVWQPSHRNRRPVWGSKRGRYSERDADAYAIRKTREWRKLHGFGVPKL